MQAGESVTGGETRELARDCVELLIKVEPLDIGPRASDNMPAEVPIDLSLILGPEKKERRIDVASIEIVRVAEDERTEMPSPGFLYGKKRSDRPVSWYDDAIPYNFPEVASPPDGVTGMRKRETVPRGGYTYASLGDWHSGRLAWTHTQDGSAPSYYRVLFQLLPVDKSPSESPPQGWLGNGLPRFGQHATTTTGMSHTRVAVTDWNGDGLTDIIYGETYGHVFVMINTGTKEHPVFRSQRMIMEADGQPLDAGIGASPAIIDWDGDGVEDLLVGTHWNRIVFFKNVGTNANRRFVYKGLVKVDGKPLEVPWSPVVGRPAGIFTRDYYPMLEPIDWNGDGQVDLLAGGYVTGRIFFFENVGRNSDGTPSLKLRGPLEANGEPINARDWSAAPTVADFNGDGKPDLLVGGIPMSPASVESGAFLHYYENVGEKDRPVLVEKPFPKLGEFPTVRMASPRAVDWNHDGKIDLVVSSGSNIYLSENVGTMRAPMFSAPDGPIVIPWSNDPLPARYFMDWNGDEFPDAMADYSVWVNLCKPNPYAFGARTVSVPDGNKINHRSGVGDDWLWSRLCDFEGSGKLDALVGDWEGHIWLHRNLGDKQRPRYDLGGVLLMTTSGQPMKVGPIGLDPSKSFRALQGARIVFAAADYNKDGLTDLVVGDTYGILRYYENKGERNAPVFSPPVEIGNLGERLNVEAVDWNHDGYPDVIAGSANGKARIFLNNGTKASARFAKGTDLKLSSIVQPEPVMVDLDRDGDEDLFIPGPQGSVLIDRSFLDHGYPSARIIRTTLGR